MHTYHNHNHCNQPQYRRHHHRHHRCHYHRRHHRVIHPLPVQVKGNRLKSVRWTGLIATEYDEKYTFFVTTHPANQVRVSVDNRWVVNRFNVTSIDLDGKGAPANSFNLQVCAMNGRLTWVNGHDACIHWMGCVDGVVNVWVDRRALIFH